MALNEPQTTVKLIFVPGGFKTSIATAPTVYSKECNT
jgi:hypothetical protein